MSDYDDDAPLTAVDVAYDFIDKANDEWSEEEVRVELRLYGFSVSEDELAEILDAVVRRFARENDMFAAIAGYLGKNGYVSLEDAAEKRGCSIDEVVDQALKDAGLTKKVH